MDNGQLLSLIDESATTQLSEVHRDSSSFGLARLFFSSSLRTLLWPVAATIPILTGSGCSTASTSTAPPTFPAFPADPVFPEPPEWPKHLAQISNLEYRNSGWIRRKDNRSNELCWNMEAKVWILGYEGRDLQLRLYATDKEEKEFQFLSESTIHVESNDCTGGWRFSFPIHALQTCSRFINNETLNCIIYIVDPDNTGCHLYKYSFPFPCKRTDYIPVVATLTQIEDLESCMRLHFNFLFTDCKGRSIDWAAQFTIGGKVVTIDGYTFPPYKPTSDEFTCEDVVVDIKYSDFRNYLPEQPVFVDLAFDFSTPDNPHRHLYACDGKVVFYAGGLSTDHIHKKGTIRQDYSSKIEAVEEQIKLLKDVK